MTLIKTFTMVLFFFAVTFLAQAQMLSVQPYFSVYKPVIFENKLIQGFAQDIPVEFKDIISLHAMKGVNSKNDAGRLIKEVEGNLINDSKDSWLVLKQAILYYDNEEYSKSESILEKLMESDPTPKILENAFFYLGLIDANRQAYGECKFYFERVIAINPKRINAYINLGVTYFFLKKYDKARESFEDAMVLNPDDSAALFYKGLLKYKNGDKARAVEAFRYSGMIGKSDFSDKWIDSIFSKDEQVASLINRLQKNPGDVKIKVSLAMAYLDYGKVKKALYYLEDAIKKNPDDVLAYAGIAEAYLQQERFAESEKVLLGILKKYPLEEALVYSSIGRVRYYARDFEGAEKYLLLSINSSVQEKTDYFPRALLGQLYVREGRIKEAQVQLEECRKSKMDDDEIDELEMKINRYERMHNGEK